MYKRQHYNHDEASVEFDKNGFLVRPDPVGVFADGSAKMSDPPTSIRLEWADDCRHRKLLGGLLKDYRSARKEQACLLYTSRCV